MTDLSPYIKQLLFRNDCVIIPSFGGVMAQYSSAQVHPIQNIFTPPAKSLAFNKSLSHNDGLLASEIVRYTGVSYDASLLAINQYVRKLETDLQSKGQAVITGIGKFYYDVERNLIFESFNENNFLTNAFGLDRFVSSPVMRREEAIAQIEKIVAPQKAKRKFSWVGVGAAVALILLVVSAVTFKNPMNPVYIETTGIGKFFSSNSSSDNSSTQNNSSESTHRKDTLIQIIVMQQPKPNEVVTPTIDSTGNVNGYDLASAISFANSYREDSVSKNENVVFEKSGPKFYLIFACFKSQSRTEKFISQMKEKGLDVSVLVEDSYIRVGKGVFNSMDEALLQQHNYHRNGFADVWVLKK